MRLVYGVGTSSKGAYAAYVNSMATKEYECWKGMLRRCYSEKMLQKCPTYRGCTVSPEFLDFQTFAEWANRQVGFKNEGFQLEKDILFRGNKVYSPGTCVFVPSRINALLISCRAVRGVLPIGVDFHKGRYRSRVQLGDGSSEDLGYFSSAECAFNGYKAAKERAIRERAKTYAEVLDCRTYEALLKYEVLITD